jgi:hypothetical protein
MTSELNLSIPNTIQNDTTALAQYEPASYAIIEACFAFRGNVSSLIRRDCNSLAIFVGSSPPNKSLVSRLTLSQDIALCGHMLLNFYQFEKLLT